MREWGLRQREIKKKGKENEKREGRGEETWGFRGLGREGSELFDRNEILRSFLLASQISEHILLISNQHTLKVVQLFFLNHMEKNTKIR